MTLKERIKDIVTKNKKVALMCTLGIVGILLIFFSNIKPKNSDKKSDTVSTTEVTAQSDYESEIEQKLTEIISSIENAGEVRVMVTLESTSETVYAQNEKSNTAQNNSSYQNDYIIIDDADGENGLKVKVNEPQVKGVAVVCQGGNNPVVKQQITEAVTAVLGIGANRVSISKMK